MLEIIENYINQAGYYEQILVEILLSALLVQMFYYLFFYLRIFFTKKKVKSNEKPPVSVIICAKNESENIKNFLPLILNQKYENFEVIVVNDASADNTEEVLAKMKQDYKHLYITNIEDNKQFQRGKKLAMTLGIKAAKNEHLIFTDADCMAVSDNWISSIIENYTPNTEIVLGYGGYIQKKGLLNKLIRFDTMAIALQYMTFAKAKFTYMGVGRNLSYKKSLYTKQRGFSSHYHIMSGDDDLFVNGAATRKNTSATFNKESFTRSEPKMKYKYFINQKRRHLTTGKHYKFFHKILLGGEIFSRFAFYMLFILSLSLNILPIVALSIFGLRFLIQMIIYTKASFVFNEKKILFWIPIFDIILPIINVWVVLSNKIIKKRRKNVWL